MKTENAVDNFITDLFSKKETLLSVPLDTAIPLFEEMNAKGAAGQAALVQILSRPHAIDRLLNDYPHGRSHEGHAIAILNLIQIQTTENQQSILKAEGAVEAFVRNGGLNTEIINMLRTYDLKAQKEILAKTDAAGSLGGHAPNYGTASEEQFEAVVELIKAQDMEGQRDILAGDWNISSLLGNYTERAETLVSLIDKQDLNGQKAVLCAGSAVSKLCQEKQSEAVIGWIDKQGRDGQRAILSTWGAVAGIAGVSYRDENPRNINKVLEWIRSQDEEGQRAILTTSQGVESGDAAWSLGGYGEKKAVAAIEQAWSSPDKPAPSGKRRQHEPAGTAPGN